MILKRTFIYKTDDDYGHDGWAPKWIHKANVLPAEIIPHDVLEHIETDETCRYVDELKALGASIYVRTQPGWYYRHRPNSMATPAEHLASTLYHEVLREAHYEGATIRQPPRTVWCAAEYEIEAALDACARTTRDEADVGEELGLFSAQMRACMQGWLRIGYRRAQRAYKGHPQLLLVDAWDKLARAVPEHDVYIGDLLHVTFDTRTLHGSVQHESATT